VKTSQKGATKAGGHQVFAQKDSKGIDFVFRVFDVGECNFSWPRLDANLNIAIVVDMGLVMTQQFAKRSLKSQWKLRTFSQFCSPSSQRSSCQVEKQMTLMNSSIPLIVPLDSHQWAQIVL